MVRLVPVESRRSLTMYLLTFLAWVGVTIAAALMNPNPAGHGTHRQLGLPACPSAVIFERPCPGCGLTTSFTATVHFDFGRAWSAHPFGSLMYFALTLAAIAGIYGYSAKRAFDIAEKPLNRLLIAFLVVYLSFCTWRFAYPPPNYDDPRPLDQRMQTAG